MDALSCICKFSHCSDALRQLMRLPVVKYEINSQTRQLVMLMIEQALMMHVLYIEIKVKCEKYS